MPPPTPEQRLSVAAALRETYAGSVVKQAAEIVARVRRLADYIEREAARGLRPTELADDVTHEVVQTVGNLALHSLQRDAARWLENRTVEAELIERIEAAGLAQSSHELELLRLRQEFDPNAPRVSTSSDEEAGQPGAVSLSVRTDTVLGRAEAERQAGEASAPIAYHPSRRLAPNWEWCERCQVYHDPAADHPRSASPARRVVPIEP